MQKEITALKEWLGVDPKLLVGSNEADEKAALTVKKTFEADMAQFAATLPPDNSIIATHRVVVEHEPGIVRGQHRTAEQFQATAGSVHAR